MSMVFYDSWDQNYSQCRQLFNKPLKYKWIKVSGITQITINNNMSAWFSASILMLNQEIKVLYHQTKPAVGW